MTSSFAHFAVSRFSLLLDVAVAAVAVAVAVVAVAVAVAAVGSVSDYQKKSLFKGTDCCGVSCCTFMSIMIDGC